ncbi:MAG: hypothetical protein H5T44_03595 [Thermoplasmatales archaeon]|nr:hypothetical protein [Thermoplasmatales archaeon]
MKKIFLAISIILLISGAYTRYKKTKELNEMVCQGCIAIISKSQKFEEFWIEYPHGYGMSGIPSHPQWALNYSKDKVLMIFFYGPACEPCNQQWEEMKKAGMVEGNEKDGKFSENFSYAILFTIDISDDREDTIIVYNSKRSVPTTVIMFEKNDKIYWYSFSGPPDGKGGRPSIEELKNILERARDEKWSAI